MNWKLLAACLLLWPLEAQAVELHYIHVVKGTQGLSHVPVTVRNTGITPISCTIQLAHWYSVGLGEALPGAHTDIDLWFDKASGTYLVLNDIEDNMPVEAVWCGIAGRAFATRMELPLDRSKGAAPEPELMRCTAGTDRLACTKG